ncbi:hypothetical protein GCM10010317_087160 [Streptomyces mirabilis]|nr:hypothetical protein GCM10010317_087160 [Streptomyces mirabilis]
MRPVRWGNVGFAAGQAKSDRSADASAAAHPGPLSVPLVTPPVGGAERDGGRGLDH